tara:strand:+ start:3212 stop:3427 length:216 start_codon:yes stop_codon:yes gene_type:complete
MKYSFNEAQEKLYNKKCKVIFSSLTSDKTHTGNYTIPKKIQSQSDKLLVLNTDTDKWEDIEINTIQDIQSK